MKHILTFLLFAFFTGCSVLNPENNDSRELWASKNITSYSVEYNRACFCAYRGPVTLVVKNNKIAEILDPTTGKPFSPARNPEWYETIDDVFASIEELKKNKPKTLEITYDKTYGFPTTINYNQSDMIADEEFSLTLSNFKLL